MKKLQNKVFTTIYFILTFFIVMYFLVSNYRSYNFYTDSIEKNIRHVSMNINHEFDNKVPAPRNDFENRVFIDYNVYTFYLTDNNDYYKVIDHSGSDNYSEVKKHVDALLKSKNEIKSGIRNIYFNKYSYVYKNGSYLVVIDMTNARNELIKELIQSLIIFVLLEIIIFFIVKVLTRWITKPAVESFKNQKEFIADASHELKTPIAIIMASADEIGETKTNKQYLQNIKDETEKMNQLVTNLLTLSKLDSNVETLFEVIDISKIINKNSLKFESIAFENKVKIKTNIEDNILFNCNNLEINQLVSILLDNAIEHSYENSTIEVNLSSDKKNIYLEVINKGDVISDKDIEKIFDRFYRSDKSRNRNTNHYGLGLSIAKNIVIKHNGTINVTSKDDKTCFKIIFKK